MEELIKDLKEIRERAEALNERLYAYIECEGMREIEALEYGPIMKITRKTSTWRCRTRRPRCGIV
jgi:hypothetical protein